MYKEVSAKITTMLVIILGLVAIAWAAYKLYTDIFSYWERRGFPSAGGKFPLGSDPCLSCPTNYLGLEIQKFYKKFAGHPCVGIYVGRRPDLVVRDPQLIKNILVKDFNNFRDRKGESSSKDHPLMQHLFALEGWKWRALRVKLTPTFTSGKLKLMFGMFIACAQKLELKLREESESNEQGFVDIKDIIARFTTDLIGSCAFGLEMDSLNNPSEPLRKIGVRLFQPDPRRRRVEILTSIFPALRERFRNTKIPKDMETLFIDGIAQTIESREKSKIRRNDFVDLLLDLKKQGSLDLEDEILAKENDSTPAAQGHGKLDLDLGLMAAQCFVFFLAGFETSSSVQSYALYELAYHQVVQDKLRREIEEVTEKYGGINYQALHDMPYLDQVINETIRKYPTLHTLTRVCTKPYRIPGTDLVIDEGITVLIPVYSLHHDPQNFRDPERFDPERFSEVNKSSITPYTFMPFGEGPRNCIGMRFGLLQTKVGIVTLIKNHRVLPSPLTDSPLVMKNALSVFTLVDGKIILRLENV